jgi:hypothetical protein
MVEVLKDYYFSKADAFILPLTGLSNNRKFTLRSFLFWEDFDIENFNLIVTYSYEDREEFVKYARKFIFPILDKNGYLLESYDFKGMSVFILDLSEWAMDITQFLRGKYSKLSKVAKEKIWAFHAYYVKDEERLPVHIYSTLYPNKKTDIEIGDGKKEEGILGKLTPIEYVAKNYGFSLTELQKVGELGSIYDIKNETLTIGQENLQEA